MFNRKITTTVILASLIGASISYAETSPNLIPRDYLTQTSNTGSAQAAAPVPNRKKNIKKLKMKVLNERQRASLEKSIAKLSSDKIEKVLAIIDAKSRDSSVSEIQKNLYDDVRALVALYKVKLDSLITIQIPEANSTGSLTQTDCKTLDVKSILNGVTDENKLASECINNAIISCTPAKLKILGTGTSMLIILGKEDDNCIIENTIITKSVSNKPSAFEYYNTCKFPIEKFIMSLDRFYKKSDASRELFLMGLSFIKSSDDAQIDKDGWYTNETTNFDDENIEYKCK